MATGSFSGSTQLASGQAVSATCSLWLTSRTWPGGTPPAQGAATPTGVADFGPVTSGTTFGGPGNFTISSVTEGDYYLLVVYSGTNYWSGPYSVVENTDVVHISGTETITGNKVFSGTVVLGKGTAATTQTAGGATQNTLDDGSGNTAIAGYLKENSTSTTIPNIWFGAAASGTINLGTNYGLDLDNNSAIAINAKSGANGGVYTMRGGTKSVTVDDGSGNTSTGALTVSGTFTYSGGTMSLPNGVIPYAAIIGGAVSGAAVDIGSTQTITGPKTMANDLPVLGGKIQGAQINSPAAPTITNVGAAGSTVYLYKVVATTYDGRDTIPSDVGSTATGNATLNGTNYNTVTWSAVTGAASYKVLKWTGTAWALLAGGVTGTSYNDQGGSTSAYTLITTNPGGELTAQTEAIIGDITNTGGQYIGAALSTPPTPTVTPTGGTGAVSYSYAVVGVSADGRDTLESAAGSTATGVVFGSLTQSVYNLIQWTTLNNVAGIKVIRTVGGASQGQITTTLLPPNATSFKDTGLAASVYTAVTVVNPGGEISGTLVQANANAASIVAARCVGTVPVGGPTSGTWLTNDYGFDTNGHHTFCTSGGTPGTWKSPYAWGEVARTSLTANSASITNTTPPGGTVATVTYTFSSLRKYRIRGFGTGVISTDTAIAAAGLFTATPGASNIQAQVNFTAGAGGAQVPFYLEVEVDGTLSGSTTISLTGWVTSGNVAFSGSNPPGSSATQTVLTIDDIGPA